jgi:2'-5' RNA ligase
MPVYVIAPLDLDGGGSERIAGWRRAYDPHAALVPPHVTLVFGLDEGMEARAVGWARTLAAATPPLALRYTRVAVTRDYENSAWYLFLMPREIPARLAALQARLNAGPLAGAPEVPFDAHVTIGRFQERVLADAVAREANAAAPIIDARIASLEVLRFDGSVVTSTVSLPLGGS